MLSKRVVILATTVIRKALFHLPLVVESDYNHTPSNSEYTSAPLQQDQNLNHWRSAKTSISAGLKSLFKV